MVMPAAIAPAVMTLTKRAPEVRCCGVVRLRCCAYCLLFTRDDHGDDPVEMVTRAGRC